MSMIVRPPQIFLDTLGNPAENWFCYVGRPNTDPKQEVNQLDITSAEDGSTVSNPFKVSRGLARNANGEQITPVISQQEYSLRFESDAGGAYYEIPRFIGDALGAGGGGTGGIPDTTLDNLTLALNTDLSSFNFVFIKAESPGWEGTATGANVCSFYYRDGTTGTPSTGDELKFYDSVGNGWVLCISQDSQSLLTKSDSEISEDVTSTPISASKIFKGFTAYSVDIFVGAELDTSDGSQSSETTISVGSTGDCTMQGGYSTIIRDTGSVTGISNSAYGSVNIPTSGSQVIAAPTFLLPTTNDASHNFKFTITTQRDTEITITQDIVIDSGAPQFRNQGIFINITPIE